MKISDIMSKATHLAHPDDRIGNVARTMLEADVGFMPVFDGRILVGVVTDRDIAVRAVASDHGPDTAVAQIMSRDVESVSADAHVEQAAVTMSERQLRRLPVVDAEGRVVGVVGLADLARHRGEGAVGQVLTQVLRPPGDPTLRREHEEHVLDEALDESFPASDPPASTAPGHDQASDER